MQGSSRSWLTASWGWEDACKAQEGGLKDFCTPVHVYLRHSRLSHMAVSWLAGCGGLDFRLSCAQTHFCLRVSPGAMSHVHGHSAIQSLGGFVGLLECSLWDGNRNNVCPSAHTQSRACWGPLGLRNSAFQDETQRIEINKNKSIDQALQEGTVCLSVRGGINASSTMYFDTTDSQAQTHTVC